ncbi:MAG: DUF3347 domain-containing protein [Ginsengibacter sp.]
MKRLLAIIILILVLYAAYWFFFKKDSHISSPKPVAIKVQKHSDEFNNRITTAVNSYLDMKNAFVGSDTVKIKSSSQAFITSVDSMNLSELKKDDSTILIAALQEVSDIKANAEAISMENSLVEMQQDFRMVSENLYPFLKTINYEGPRLFWLSCPSAFGENREGNWINNTKQIINPYQGKGNSKSAGSNCGAVRDSID